MAHGGYDKRRVADQKPSSSRRPNPLAVQKNTNGKTKLKAKPPVSLKRQIRSTERLLRKDARPEVRESLEKKLEGLKKQQDLHNNLALQRKNFLRDRKIKFFERRKVERMIRRLERQQRSSSVQSQTQEAEIVEQLSKLKEDLEYIRFFPKTEKYVPLFKGDDTDVIDRRDILRKQIKANILAALASGKDLEETGSEDDGQMDVSEEEFFVSGSSSDEADADDEWTDKSAREQASSASGKVTSGMSSDERNQKQISARALMPPPRAFNKSSSVHGKPRYGASVSKRSSVHGDTSSNTSSSYDRSSFKSKRPLGPRTENSSNLSSNSDAQKPRRKRRPKKKKQQG